MRLSLDKKNLVKPKIRCSGGQHFTFCIRQDLIKHNFQKIDSFTTMIMNQNLSIPNDVNDFWCIKIFDLELFHWAFIRFWIL